MTELREQLQGIRTFPSLVKFLREELDWPIDSTADFEDLTFEYTPDELGIDLASAAKIESIQRLRPLSTKQPWGIFFVKFEPKKLPIVALRRLLSQVALKKRASANSAERAAWAADDLLFISNYGEGDQRQITFAQFSQDKARHELPTLRVLGWNNLDTPLHLDDAADTLRDRLVWPDDEDDVDGWRDVWRSAFTLRPREVITTSRDLSIRLAELARAIRDRIRTALAIETATGPLTKLLKAFQEALVHDLSSDGFSDMYAQTIAYGLLSARIAKPTGSSADDLSVQMPVTNPFLRELMETFLHVGGRRGKVGGPGIDFDELGVSEIVALLDRTNIEAVVRDFGDRNPDEDPVIHFYEHFLAAYDKKQKASRGVFYTPRPVVSYIVRCADAALQSEFGLAAGLAATTTWGEMVERDKNLAMPDGVRAEEPFVQILDPATGTGTFLVEVIDLIYRRVSQSWRAQGRSYGEIAELWDDYVPKHLLPRLHGYELLMAPYAIAHLKIGLKLHETGYRFASNERVRVFLTNALEPDRDFAEHLDFAIPALAQEAEAVNLVKRGKRFTVVIGNPPYATFGQQNRIAYIIDMLADYKAGLNEKKINLDDDFIKFVRLAQALATKAGFGVVGMITNNVFLDGLTHRRMREALAESFSAISVLDLHGNASAHEAAADGSRDENVFEITQGVAISLMRRAPGAQRPTKAVDFAEIYGARAEKYRALLAGAIRETRVAVRPPQFFFVPKDLTLTSEYEQFVPLPEVFQHAAYGIQTKRDALTVAFEQDEMLARAETVLESDDATVRETFGLPPDGRDWTVAGARADLARLGDLAPNVRQVLYRPFDERWTIYTDRSKGFLAYPRWASLRCMLDSNLGLIAMRQVFQQVELYSHFGVTDRLIDERTFYSNRGGTSLFPLWAASSGDGGNAALAGFETVRRHNFDKMFLERLGATLGTESGVGDANPEAVFAYLFATLRSPAFRRRYGSLLKLDFPRVPLPASVGLFEELARIGVELIKVQLMQGAPEQPVARYVGPKSPLVSAIAWTDGTVWLDASAKRSGTSAGATGASGFHGVSEEIWAFEIGGYQVCRKWLKDRKDSTLTPSDTDHYLRIIDAVNATIQIECELDQVIDEHGGWPDAFATAR